MVSPARLPDGTEANDPDPVALDTRGVAAMLSLPYSTVREGMRESRYGPAWKEGKRWLVRASDVHAYVERRSAPITAADLPDYRAGIAPFRRTRASAARGRIRAVPSGNALRRPDRLDQLMAARQTSA